MRISSECGVFIWLVINAVVVSTGNLSFTTSDCDLFTISSILPKISKGVGIVVDSVFSGSNADSANANGNIALSTLGAIVVMISFSVVWFVIRVVVLLTSVVVSFSVLSYFAEYEQFACSTETHFRRSSLNSNASGQGINIAPSVEHW